MAQIQDEFLFIASHALRQRPGIETLRVRAVQPSRNGPIVAYVRGPIGPPPDTNFGRPYGEAPPDAVLEGVMRVLQVRWRGGPPVAMRFDDEAWRAPLHRVYPGTFESGGPHSWAGWRFIWLAAAEWIEEIGKPDDWECGQTKEKFGSLRWYVRIPMEAGHPFRREAGQRSDLMSATIPR